VTDTSTDQPGTVSPETKGSEASPRRRYLRWALWGLLVVVLAALVGAGAFVYWGLTPQQATPAALAALQGGDGVKVTDTPAGYRFALESMPTTDPIGLVLYPGGHVDPRAYAPLATQIARQGVVVVVPRMPLSLAFLDIDAARRAIAADPGIRTWIVGGHSLGGTAACLFVKGNPGVASGLLLLASYPPEGCDLSAAKGPDGKPLKVLSIRGKRDEIVTPVDIPTSKDRLPPDTVYLTIPGGNHGQFGSYGPQTGDGTPKVTAQGQQVFTALAINRLLRSLR
jgi:dienelactone hydrolase